MLSQYVCGSCIRRYCGGRERIYGYFMGKKVRITLYILSLITIGIVIWAIIFAGERNKKLEQETDGNRISFDTEVSDMEMLEGVEDTEEEKVEQEDTILLFAGDVLIQAEAEKRYDAEGITGIVSEEILAAMTGADIMMVNNEFQFSTRGEPMEDKQYTFQTEPKYVQVLLDLGVDIVSLANNHTLDFGKEALVDTMKTLDDAGILHAGAGETKERAEELQIIEVNGKKFGFLAATRVIPVSQWNIDYGQPGLFATYDPTNLVGRIEEAKEQCDFLSVYVHWGIERVEYPKAYERVLATKYFEAGADIVIGSHPHVLQGMEFIDGKPVFYSLGNYIFRNTIAKTMLVEVTVKADGAVSYRLLPAFAEGGKTQLSTDEKAQSLYNYLTRISANVRVESDGSLTELAEWKDISYETMVPPETEAPVTEQAITE